VKEHRTIALFENIARDNKHQVGADTDEVRVESGMMKLAESESIGDDWLTAGVPVGEDMGRIEELAMAQSADRAHGLVGANDALTERLLMYSLHYLPCRVASFSHSIDR
jgi:hypothetical protein